MVKNENRDLNGFEYRKCIKIEIRVTIRIRLTKPLVIDRQCPLSICLTWMSHRLHNSERKRLGTIVIGDQS